VILPADLLAPKGPVEVTLFPGESTPPEGGGDSPLIIRLLEYIEQAEIKSSEIAFPEPDTAVRNWALHLAFDAAYVLAISRAATENSMVPVLGSEGYMKDQRDGLKAKADAYAAAYQLLESAVTVISVEQPRSYQSRQTPIIYEW
jgi:hypothetical protein